ncbi:MAG: glycosyltransferase [Clostridiales bacterium]|nr:UDP-N-acetylglucosamine--LPS N-acetylglucosamine transferase [Eubacteriales bacterium]MDH7565819.1 glycosyltransferase [Clostridiales bacterium]
MVNNILILSSDYTGHGHKSIASALVEQFSLYPNAKVHVVDGFTLGGAMSLRIGKAYGPLTRRSKELWKMVWDITNKMPSVVCEFMQSSIHHDFLKLIAQVKPDVIACVHPAFITPALNILEEYGIRIPVVSIVADLVTISPLWADARAEYTLCPTLEAKEKCVEFGVPESKIEVLGFPVREKFCRHIGQSLNESDYAGNKPLECLIMSGGEGSGNMSRLANLLLKNFNCRVKIITGRNTLLKKRLELTLLEKYAGRVEIYGFTENVQDLMLASDIAFTRGSPNVMMEAVLCNVPLVVTGALPGQEEGNPEFIEKYHLGVVCRDATKLQGVLNNLLADNARKLNRIKMAQREFRNPDAAKNIVKLIMSMEVGEAPSFPDIPKRSFKNSRVNRFIIKRIKYRQKVR